MDRNLEIRNTVYKDNREFIPINDYSVADTRVGSTVEGDRMASNTVAGEPPHNNDCTKHTTYNFTCGTCNGLFTPTGCRINDTNYGCCEHIRFEERRTVTIAKGETNVTLSRYEIIPPGTHWCYGAKVTVPYK